MGRLQGDLAKAGRIGHALPGQAPTEVGRDVEEGVECAAGERTPNARHGGQAPTDQVAARLEFTPHLLDAVLVPFEGREGGVLTDAAGTARLLTLDVAHGLDNVRR